MSERPSVLLCLVGTSMKGVLINRDGMSEIITISFRIVSSVLLGIVLSNDEKKSILKETNQSSFQ